MITYRVYFLSTQSPYAPSLNPRAKGPWERENRRSLTWPDLRMVNQRLKLGQHCDRKSWTYEVLNRPQLSWYFTIYITSLKHVSSAHRREKVKELPSFTVKQSELLPVQQKWAQICQTWMCQQTRVDYQMETTSAKVLIPKKEETTSKNIKLYLETTSPHLWTSLTSN